MGCSDHLAMPLPETGIGQLVFMSLCIALYYWSPFILCRSTVRSNRSNFPPELRDVAKCGLAQTGAVMLRQDENVRICVWHDIRTVTFISSCLSSTVISS